jgi:hypothetical protein
MNLNLRHLLSLALVALCGLMGWWTFRDVGKISGRGKPASRGGEIPRPNKSSPLRLGSWIQRDEFQDGTTVEIFASSEPSEVILRFPSEETYEDFLFSMAGSQKIHLLDQLDRLRAIRLGYDEWTDLSDLLAEENVIAYDSLPTVPAPAAVGGAYQKGLVGIGDGLLARVGVTSDPSNWGAGVKIAVLDTGITPHPALPGFSRSIEITPFPKDLSKTRGHGTAVASLIASNDPAAPGLAPAAELISIRVADESGKADSFALAAGILAAVDAGVQLINISMGTTEDNPLIKEAVLYADAQHVLIVAASGNSSQAEATYPAAYPCVISVGAVDARGEHLEFSNYGSFLSMTAPGYAIHTAWPGNRYATISGTSASAPVVTGAIAATMSSGSGITMSARQAAETVMKYSNEAGIPGPDSEFGFGILDMGRVMNRNTPGIVDAAITHQQIVKSGDPAGSDEIQVTVQNRGTAPLINTLVQITTPFGNRQFNATMITPGAIQTFSMPVRLSGQPKNEPVSISSNLTLSAIGRDTTPENNFRSERLYRR